MVNVACKCGFTAGNYAELQELYQKYHEKGLRIAAFPSNQFASQVNYTENNSLCFIDIKSVLGAWIGKRNQAVCHRKFWHHFRPIQQSQREWRELTSAFQLSETQARRDTWRVSRSVTHINMSGPHLIIFSFLKWNFTKFLVDRDGIPVKRYAPTDSPKALILIMFSCCFYKSQYSEWLF